MLITQTEVQAQRERDAEDAALLVQNRAALRTALERAGTTPLFEGTAPGAIRYGDKYGGGRKYGSG